MEQRIAQRLRPWLQEQGPDGPEVGGDPGELTRALEGLLLAVEEAFGGDMLTSILLLDDEGKRLLHGAAPSLPDAYSQAIHGVEIGPGVGSCGTAAYLGHPVYVVDIARDPLWADFRDLAAAHALRACWSTPIERPGGGIAGTFAVYHRTPRSPKTGELDAISVVSRAAALAIERRRLRAPRAPDRALS